MASNDEFLSAHRSRTNVRSVDLKKAGDRPAAQQVEHEPDVQHAAA
jgi:hypothetical protein